MAEPALDLIAAHEHAHHVAAGLMERFHEAMIQVSLPRRAGEFSQWTHIQSLMRSIAQEILPHLAREETELYPFLVSHVPKLEAVVKYLVGEHEDFRETFSELGQLLAKFETVSGQLDREKFILRVEQSGTYLFFLFRNHVRAEREGLFRVVEEILKPEEKAEILTLL